MGQLMKNTPPRIFGRHRRQAAQRRQYRGIGGIFENSIGGCWGSNCAGLCPYGSTAAQKCACRAVGTHGSKNRKNRTVSAVAVCVCPCACAGGLATFFAKFLTHRFHSKNHPFGQSKLGIRCAESSGMQLRYSVAFLSNGRYTFFVFLDGGYPRRSAFCTNM
jgi:hypothetical protein